MGAPDPRIDRWLSKDRPWPDELCALRDILLSENLTETLKWRKPCYVAYGGNIAILASLSDSVAVSFLKGVLLDDPEAHLEAPGPNSRSARYMRFSEMDAISGQADALRRFVRQAIATEKTGLKVALPKDDIAVPAEMVEAMDGDSDLAAAFAALTPGRQRGWALHVSAAKRSDTRRLRIERARPAILDGRGIHDR